MAELNGEAPVDKEYTKHVLDQLNEHESDDDSDTTSNAYESVRDVVYLPSYGSS